LTISLNIIVAIRNTY